MATLLTIIRKAIDNLSQEPPPRKVFVDYRHLLTERKNKVLRIAKNAADDGNVYAAIRSKQILRKIESFDYRIVSKQSKPIHAN